MPPPEPDARGSSFSARAWRYSRGVVHPVVLIFLLAALFSELTGDIVRAAYLLAVGLALAWDRARPRRPRPLAAPGEAGGIPPPRAAVFSAESAARRRPR